MRVKSWRRAWAWAEWVVMIPDLSAETRRAALRAFESLFEPGGIVALALAPHQGQGADAGRLG